MPEKPDGCVKPARGPIPPAGASAGTSMVEEKKEVAMSQARVGREAPDFETTAFLDGGFRNVQLSEFRGKWIVLCFYPGDFTFV
jgi:hypothetical protein